MFEPNREKTGGRKKGVTNKTTKAVKEMILAALDEVGGQEYLNVTTSGIVGWVIN